MANPLELHKERLATTDAEGWRVYLHPLEVRGFFRKRRTLVYLLLTALFLVLPWTSIDGTQTILLDIAHGRYSIFGMTFWSHDAPMMFFFLSGVAFTLAFMAVAWGRVWCGWACPQTVFIDIIYRRIETWIEGDALARRAQSAGHLTFSRLLRKILKWSAFTVVTLVISHTVLAYFAGADRVIYMIQGPPEKNVVAFLFTFILSVILLFNFGWFREQFCIIMCPYGRLQGLLMDKKSLTVIYDEKRGEPRRGKVPEGKKQGDCIDCFRCVAVCPTGIDIRRGQQLECIGCTACIDACDEIMDKVKKPRGLIRYAYGTEGGPRQFLRPATGIFLGVLTIIFTGLVISLIRHQPVSAEVLRASGAPYADGGPGIIVNHFHLEITNSLLNVATVGLETNDPAIQVVTAIRPLMVVQGGTSRIDFFVNIPKEFLKAGHFKGTLKVSAVAGEKVYFIEKELPLVGPSL